MLREEPLGVARVEIVEQPTSFGAKLRATVKGRTSRLWGETMNGTGKDDKQRNRVIANNEAERQITGDIRVSAWTIVFAIIVGAIAVFIVWAWLNR